MKAVTTIMSKKISPSLMRKRSESARWECPLPGHLNRAAVPPKDEAFHGDKQAAVIHQVPISLIERRPAAFGVPHHMNPVGQLAYGAAGKFPFVVAGKGQGNLQEKLRVLFLLADEQFRRPGVHTNGISAEKVGGAQLYSLEMAASN